MTRRAFTIVELIAVMLMLAILVGVSAPRYFDWSDAAKTSADEAAFAGIAHALNAEFREHRVADAPVSVWITELTQIAGTLETGELPRGLRVSGPYLFDQRNRRYEFVAETDFAPARLKYSPVGGGGAMPWAAVPVAMVVWHLARGARREDQAECDG